MTTSRLPLPRLIGAWLRLGALGFGGPPAHIAMLRTLCVTENHWLEAEEFEHAVATTGLLPGPASTQLAIYTAWRMGGPLGAVLGGASFILPGFVMIVALSWLFFAHHPGAVLLGAALGAGAVVPAIALTTAWSMVPASYKAVRTDQARRFRWAAYGLIGILTSILSPAFVVLALVAAGIIEILSRRLGGSSRMALITGTFHAAWTGSLGALAWVAFKVGALSYGGGFVIIPLMQRDVVSVYHWMTGAQFLNAVALGQVTPGPVVLTTAAVGFAAHGLSGAALATVVAFGPSFLFILAGASSFERLRTNKTVTAFLGGAGPCVIGAIGGSTIPLASLLGHLWQIPVVVAAVGWLLWQKGSTVWPLVGAAILGAALSHVVAI